MVFSLIEGIKKVGKRYAMNTPMLDGIRKIAADWTGLGRQATNFLGTQGGRMTAGAAIGGLGGAAFDGENRFRGLAVGAGLGAAGGYAFNKYQPQVSGFLRGKNAPAVTPAAGATQTGTGVIRSTPRSGNVSLGTPAYMGV